VLGSQAKGKLKTEIPVYLSRKEKAMGFVQIAQRRFGIAGELVSFFCENKRWWMLPMIVILLFVGILILLAQSSAIAPFVYTLF
jgi:hypothetical protein